MNDYSDYPRSLSEVRADKECRGDLWSPRDVLIDLLRAIDNGEKCPSVIFVAHGEIKTDENGKHSVSTHYSVSAPNCYVALGCLERAKKMFCE